MNISIKVINQIYLRTQLHNQETGDQCITVNGFTGQAHAFNRERLQEELPQILSALKRLPRVMLHSQSPVGVPWILARSRASAYDGCTLETAERLLMMGIALGMVRVTRREGTSTDIPSVVIDDDLLIRSEKMKPDSVRNQAIIRWHK